MAIVVLGSSVDHALKGFKHFCTKTGTPCRHVSDLFSTRVSFSLGPGHLHEFTFDSLSSTGAPPEDITGVWFHSFASDGLESSTDTQYVHSEQLACLMATLGTWHGPVLNRPRPAGNRLIQRGGIALRSWARSRFNLATPLERIAHAGDFLEMERGPWSAFRAFADFTTGGPSFLQSCSPDELLLGLNVPLGQLYYGIHVGPHQLWFSLTDDYWQQREDPPERCRDLVEALFEDQGEEFGCSYFVLSDDGPSFLGCEAHPPPDILCAFGPQLFPLIHQYLS